MKVALFTSLAALALSTGFVAACSNDDSTNTATASSGAGGMSDCTANVAPSSDDTTTVQGALIAAKDGDVVCFAAGSYKFTQELTLDSNNVTLRGVAGTVFDFSGMMGGANGLHIQANGALVDTMEIDDPKGDGVRADEAEGFTIRNVTVIWHETDEAKKMNNGPYGIYPVTSSKVLVENCKVSGASDTGIYVGQSHDIVVRNNEVYGNVCGIEIENSTMAEVYGNKSHDNTGGILVFALPNLPMTDSNTAFVHDNTIEHNNGTNFAPAGNIVASVPQGTGVLIMASDNNEIAKNTIDGNESVGIAIVSYLDLMKDPMAPGYDLYPQGNWVHDNKLSGDGQMPKGIAAGLKVLVGAATIPELAWDGEVDPTKPNTDGSLTNCFSGNNASFVDFDFAGNGMNTSTDITPYTCMKTPLTTLSTDGFPGE